MSIAKSVFVVDDDPGMLNGVRRLLKAHGFNAELFESIEAVSERADFDDAFCVVIDIDLHGRSGIDLRREMTSRGIRLPVVFITAIDDDAVRKAALDSGCIAYLIKPFTAKALMAPIEEAASLPI